MKKLLIILLVPLLFIGCKKDKLKGEKSKLIGVWQWSYTIHDYDICTATTQSEILTPATENFTYELEFKEKGYLIYRKDGKLAEKNRMVFSDWRVSEHPDYFNNPDYSFFRVYLNNKKESPFSGEVGTDTLLIYGSKPLGGYCSGCCRYVNYYTKQ